MAVRQICNSPCPFARTEERALFQRYKRNPAPIQAYDPARAKLRALSFYLVGLVDPLTVRSDRFFQRLALEPRHDRKNVNRQALGRR
jgi:hypothetical protein